MTQITTRGAASPELAAPFPQPAPAVARPAPVVDARDDAAELLDITIVMPCLDEEEGVGICVRKALSWLERSGHSGEVIVVDNGSTDRSVEVASQAGARVIPESRRGYGRAYLTGLAATRSRYIVMGDADDTYDFSDLDALIRPLEEGVDLVIANRFKGGVAAGAMPWTHRYIGTPAINLLMNMFTGAKVGDSQSGFRAFTREAYQRMGLRSEGMEFASEMVVRSARGGLRITEVPMPYLPRVGETKLRTFRDGWRHLRYLLTTTPNVLFLAPGALLVVLGLLTSAFSLVSPGGLEAGSMTWQPVFASTIFLTVGANAVLLGLISKRQAAKRGILPADRWTVSWERHFSLEGALVVAAAMIAIGAVIDAFLLGAWLSDSDLSRGLQLGALAQSLLIVGANIVLVAFLAVMMEQNDDDPIAVLHHAAS